MDFDSLAGTVSTISMSRSLSIPSIRSVAPTRPESPTWLQHVEVELTEDNHRALYVPERFAHGHVIDDDWSRAVRGRDLAASPGNAGAIPQTAGRRRLGCSRGTDYSGALVCADSLSGV